jgi:hypothetical protein
VANGKGSAEGGDVEMGAKIHKQRGPRGGVTWLQLMLELSCKYPKRGDRVVEMGARRAASSRPERAGGPWGGLPGFSSCLGCPASCILSARAPAPAAVQSCSSCQTGHQTRRLRADTRRCAGEGWRKLKYTFARLAERARTSASLVHSPCSRLATRSNRRARVDARA